MTFYLTKLKFSIKFYYILAKFVLQEKKLSLCYRCYTCNEIFEEERDKNLLCTSS